MLTFLRYLLWLPTPLITPEQALQIARTECQECALEWELPEATEGLRTWIVWAASEFAGSPRIVSNNHSGKMISTSFLRW